MSSKLYRARDSDQNIRAEGPARVRVVGYRAR
jgi:hypothetical protein